LALVNCAKYASIGEAARPLIQLEILRSPFYVLPQGAKLWWLENLGLATRLYERVWLGLKGRWRLGTTISPPFCHARLKTMRPEARRHSRAASARTPQPRRRGGILRLRRQMCSRSRNPLARRPCVSIMSCGHNGCTTYGTFFLTPARCFLTLSSTRHARGLSPLCIRREGAPMRSACPTRSNPPAMITPPVSRSA
jgi:hypothetical protein